MLPGKPSDPRRTAGNTLLLVKGCRWVLRSAAHWRDLPQRHGKWETLQKRFTRWSKSAVWDEVFAALIKHCNHPYLMLDTTLLRAHQHAGRKKSPQDQALGRARGELISKIQMAPDRLERDPFSIAQTLS